MPGPPTTLSDTELYSIQDGIVHGIRLDGRQLREHRLIQISPPRDAQECDHPSSSSVFALHEPSSSAGESTRKEQDHPVSDGNRVERKEEGLSTSGKEMVAVVEVRLGDTLVMATASSSVFRDERWCEDDEKEEEKQEGNTEKEDHGMRGDSGEGSVLSTCRSFRGEGMLDITLGAVPRAISEYASALIGGGGKGGNRFSGGMNDRARYLLSTLALTLRQIYGARQVRLLDSTLVDGAAVAEELLEPPLLFSSAETGKATVKEDKEDKGEAEKKKEEGSAADPRCPPHIPPHQEDSSATASPTQRGEKEATASVEVSPFLGSSPCSCTPSFSSGFPAEALYIDLGFAFHIRVDLVILESAGGNLLTALSTAVYTALQRLALPHVTLHRGPRGVVAEIDPQRCFTMKPIPPLEARLSRVVVMGISPTRQYIVDPTWEEEVALPQQLHVAVNAEGQVTYVRYQQWPSRRGGRRLRPSFGARKRIKTEDNGTGATEEAKGEGRRGSPLPADATHTMTTTMRDTCPTTSKTRAPLFSSSSLVGRQGEEEGKDPHREGEDAEEVEEGEGGARHAFLARGGATTSYLPDVGGDVGERMKEGSHQGGAFPVGVHDFTMAVIEAVPLLEAALVTSLERQG